MVAAARVGAALPAAVFRRISIRVAAPEGEGASPTASLSRAMGTSARISVAGCIDNWGPIEKIARSGGVPEVGRRQPRSGCLRGGLSWATVIGVISHA